MIGLRADASQSVGVGHVSRMLGLAEALHRQKVPTVWLTENPMVEWREQFEQVGSRAIDLEIGSSDADLLSALRHAAVSTVVFDGYHFGVELLQTVAAANHRVVVVDDTATQAIPAASLTVNPTGVSGQRHGNGPGLLAGPSFLPLRRSSVSIDKELTFQGSPQCVRVLVVFGGTDPTGGAARALAALELVEPTLEVLVATGYAEENSYHQVRLRQIASESKHRTTLVGPQPSLSELYRWADIGVCAAGTAMWELDASGVAVIACSVIENQEGAVLHFLDHPRHQVLTDFWSSSNEDLANVFEQCIRRVSQRDFVSTPLCDGYGADRLAATICDLPYIRRSNSTDVEFLYRLAHEPSVRESSFDSSEFSFASHQAWFTNADCSSNTKLFTACLVTQDGQDRRIGQFRAVHEPRGVVVSVSICESVRGHGYGSRLVELGSAEAQLHFPGLPLIAEIKASNKVSQACFQQAGYQLQTRTTKSPTVEMTLNPRETDRQWI
jgi:UDP-2,4-diacetamido-2,4,6-trideoxy-beta-L-altropyranose hydrolase